MTAAVNLVRQRALLENPSARTSAFGTPTLRRSISRDRGLSLKKSRELPRGEYLRARRSEVLNVPRADDIGSVFGGRFADDAVFDILVPPDCPDSSGV